MQFIPIDPSSDSVIVTMPPALIATHGDFVVAASIISQDVSLFKRNADGYYEKKATVSVPGAPYEITTDGTWIAVSILGEYKSFVFQIDEDGQQTNYHEIPSEFDSASLIAPNTFVVVNFTHLKTYEYDGAKWNLIDTSAYGTPGELNYNSGSQKHRVTESTFTAVYFYDPRTGCSSCNVKLTSPGPFSTRSTFPRLDISRNTPPGTATTPWSYHSEIRSQLSPLTLAEDLVNGLMCTRILGRWDTAHSPSWVMLCCSWTPTTTSWVRRITITTVTVQVVPWC